MLPLQMRRTRNGEVVGLEEVEVEEEGSLFD
jgi:hypothetical protein